MRKFFLLIFACFIINSLKAQEVNRKIGVGLQTSFPVYGISVKYGISNSSVIQAVVAPFGAKSGGESVSLNFYGLRYIYRFPGNDEKSVVLDPYLFGGGGLIHYSISDGTDKTSDNVFGYSLGGGLEVILLKGLGISAEVGYGKLSFTGGIAVNSIIAGGGLHYYFK